MFQFEVPLLKTIYCHWDDWKFLWDLYGNAPWGKTSSLPLSAEHCLKEVNEWIKAFVLIQKFYRNSHSPWWFTSTCSAAVVHRQQAFCHLNRCRLDTNGWKCIASRNHYKNVTAPTKCRYIKMKTHRVAESSNSWFLENQWTVTYPHRTTSQHP